MTAARTRAEARLAWTREVLGMPDVDLIPASSDASARSYFRTRGGMPSRIVMDSPPELEDPRPWLDIGKRLAVAGLHVPAVEACDLRRGFLLIEDLGSRLYLDALDGASADGLYADAMDALVRMQAAVSAAALPAYDRAFLIEEMELMPAWFLDRHLGRAPDPAARETLTRTFALLADAAATQPQCFVHRDYHSRNLLVVAPDPGAAGTRPWASPGIIDFQGARLGPLTYDLASLLRDCYIAWDHERVEAWTERCRVRLLATRWREAVSDRARFRRWVDLTGLQRHVKVLGIFCRLRYRDGKGGYLGDLPRVFGYAVDVASRYPELHALAALLERSAGDRDLRLPAESACATP